MGILSRIFGATSDRSEDAGASNVTGEWEGHYTQHHDKRPIKAALTQEGNRISGTMTDVKTETELSLYDGTAEAGMPPGSDEKIDEQIREMMPEVGNAPIRVKSILPGESQLDGMVDGIFVRFTKVYRGQHFVGFQVADKRIGHVFEEHSVQYSGRLSGDGKTIEGFWTIEHSGAPAGANQGTFVLRKS